MSLAPVHGRLQIPDSLQAQLAAFRRRLRAVKLAEGALIAAFVLALAFLTMFATDRAIDTPRLPRVLLFASAVLGLVAVPHAAYRWVWGSRRFEQLARILSRTEPRVGDRLLGVIELARSDSEQARSFRLVEAAIGQVAEDSAHRDFRTSIPNPRRYRAWGIAAAIPIAIVVGLFAWAPIASSNSLARLVAPWSSTPRYTFAAIVPLPAKLVVPHGEPFVVTAALAESTESHPAAATARLGDQAPVTASLINGRYEFAFPAQIAPGRLDVRVGDSRHGVEIDPTHRPELTGLTADVTLPDYLGRDKPASKDVRGGAISLVKGSVARFLATASRDLASAKVDGSPRVPVGPAVQSPETAVDASRSMEFRWTDSLGLEGKAPFALAIAGREDEAPTLSCEGLPRQKVILDSEMLSFKVRAHDDFGVRKVGLEWHGLPDPNVKTPASGEKILAAGGNDKEILDLPGTFAAKGLGIEPQAITLRVFAEDYKPGRVRTYSAPYTLFVLDPEQHAIWLTEQLSKWHRMALEVRDREMQLHESNRQIRALSPEELDRPETRRKVENQAAAEKSNGRRLSALSASGEDLVKQATRNPEFGVGHLEKWAEMLQILKDISANRMPSVADLLKQAAQADKAVAIAPATRRPRGLGKAGQVGQGKPTEPAELNAGPSRRRRSRRSPMRVVAAARTPRTSKPGVPPRRQDPSSAISNLPRRPSPAASRPPRLPPAALEGGRRPGHPAARPAGRVREGRRRAEQGPRQPRRLEHLVKRLKAESRGQTKIAGKIERPGRSPPSASIPPRPSRRRGPRRRWSGQEAKGSQSVSSSWTTCRVVLRASKYARFKTVLDEMRQQGRHRWPPPARRRSQEGKGLSIALCEYWSDTLDRWAEDLVDPATAAACPGSASRKIACRRRSSWKSSRSSKGKSTSARKPGSPSKLARPSPSRSSTKQARTPRKLTGEQDVLRDRVVKVIDRIKTLPDAEKSSATRSTSSARSPTVMEEADEPSSLGPRPARPRSRRRPRPSSSCSSQSGSTQGSGGGGGSDPGGGGGGTTRDSALALLGNGV